MELKAMRLKRIIKNATVERRKVQNRVWKSPRGRKRERASEEDREEVASEVRNQTFLHLNEFVILHQ